MRANATAATDELREDLGAALRMVARYDPASLDRLYVRDDVATQRSSTEYERLHAELLRENLAGPHLESDFVSGRLRSSVLGFDDFLSFNFLGGDKQGYVVRVDPNAAIDFGAFLTKFETIAPVEARFGDIEFDVHMSERACPHCGSSRTISTPMAGPDASYYCTDCDSGFN